MTEKPKFHKDWTTGTAAMTFLGVGRVVGFFCNFWQRGLQEGFKAFFVAATFQSAGYICVALCLAEMLSALPFTGGTYGIVRGIIGPFLGYLIGVLEILSITGACIQLLISFGECLSTALRIPNGYEPILWLILLFVSLKLQTTYQRKRDLAFVTASIFAVSFCLIYVLGTSSESEIEVYYLPENRDNKYLDHRRTFIGMFPYPTILFGGLQLIPMVVKGAQQIRSAIGYGIVCTGLFTVIVSFSVVIVSAIQYPGSKLLANSSLPLSYGFSNLLNISVQTASILNVPFVVSSFLITMQCLSIIVGSMTESGLLYSVENFSQIIALKYNKFRDGRFAKHYRDGPENLDSSISLSASHHGSRSLRLNHDRGVTPQQQAHLSAVSSDSNPANGNMMHPDSYDLQSGSGSIEGSGMYDQQSTELLPIQVTHGLIHVATFLSTVVGFLFYKLSPNAFRDLTSLYILTLLSIYIIILATYICFRYRFFYLARTFRNPVGIFSAVLGIAIYIIIIFTTLFYDRGGYVIAGFIVFFLGFSLLYHKYAKQFQKFNEEEEQVMFVVYVMRANQKKLRQKQQQHQQSHAVSGGLLGITSFHSASSSPRQRSASTGTLSYNRARCPPRAVPPLTRQGSVETQQEKFQSVRKENASIEQSLRAPLREEEQQVEGDGSESYMQSEERLFLSQSLPDQTTPLENVADDQEGDRYLDSTVDEAARAEIDYNSPSFEPNGSTSLGVLQSLVSKFGFSSFSSQRGGSSRSHSSAGGRRSRASVASSRSSAGSMGGLRILPYQLPVSNADCSNVNGVGNSNKGTVYLYNSQATSSFINSSKKGDAVSDFPRGIAEGSDDEERSGARITTHSRDPAYDNMRLESVDFSASQMGDIAKTITAKFSGQSTQCSFELQSSYKQNEQQVQGVNSSQRTFARNSTDIIRDVFSRSQRNAGSAYSSRKTTANSTESPSGTSGVTTLQQQAQPHTRLYTHKESPPQQKSQSQNNGLSSLPKLFHLSSQDSVGNKVGPSEVISSQTEVAAVRSSVSSSKPLVDELDEESHLERKKRKSLTSSIIDGLGLHGVFDQEPKTPRGESMDEWNSMLLAAELEALQNHKRLRHVLQFDEHADVVFVREDENGRPSNEDAQQRRRRQHSRGNERRRVRSHQQHNPAETYTPQITSFAQIAAIMQSITAVSVAAGRRVISHPSTRLDHGSDTTAGVTVSSVSQTPPKKAFAIFSEALTLNKQKRQQELLQQIESPTDDAILCTTPSQPKLESLPV